VKQVLTGVERAKPFTDRTREDLSTLVPASTTGRRPVKSCKQGIHVLREAFLEGKAKAGMVSESRDAASVAIELQGGFQGSSYTQRSLARRRRQNFIKEMRLLNGLRHPCIAQIVGAVIVSGLEPMMVMVSLVATDE